MKRKHYFHISLFVFFCIIGYFGFYENLKMHRDVLLTDNLDEQQIVEKRVMAELEKMAAVTDIVAKTEEMQTLNQQEILNLFSRIKQSNTGMANMVVFDRQGQTLATMLGKNNALKIADRQGIQAALNGQTVFSDKFYAPTLQTWLVSLKTPIRANDGRIVGGLSTAITMTKLQEALKGVQFKHDATPILVDKSGGVIYYPGVDARKQEIFRKTVFNRIRWTAAGCIRLESPIDGSDTMYTYQRLGDTGWYLAVVQPMAVINFNVLIEAFYNLIIIGMGCLILYLLNKQARLQDFKERIEREARMEKLEAVGRLAAGIAHEIRNPLTSVKGFLQLLQGNPENIKNQRYLEIMAEELGQIDHIAGEFLCLAKPSAPKITIFNLNELLNNLIFILESQALMQNVKIQLDLAESLPLLTGDAGQIKQVIINLVKNAVEACDTSGGSVVISTAGDGNMVQLCVLDNGHGMTPEVLAKLGTPFFTTKENGSGLGVMVCLSIVQSMGGVIQMESKPNKGTKILVKLPWAAKLPD